MGVEDDGNFLFRQRTRNSLKCPTPQMYSAQQSEKGGGSTRSLIDRREVSSVTTPCSSTNVGEQFLVTEWDTLLPSVDRNVNFNSSAGLSSYLVGVPEIQGFNGSNSSRNDQLSRLSSFGSESFSEIAASYGLCQTRQIASAACAQAFTPAIEHCGNEKDLKGKRTKAMSDSSSLHSTSPNRIQSAEPEQQKDVSPEGTKSSLERSEKKQKIEKIQGVNSQKSSAKHAKDQPQNDDATKEDYIHIRAKRGQATNSHSLAERVRREKISERMRLLQDLVPGCNKITGKAMMLDEIINYVQSLQRQVEFLSMKLAAVNPEINFDIEQILSKDILQPRDGSAAAALVFGQGMGTLHPHLHGVMQAEIAMCHFPNSGDLLRLNTPQISPMPQVSNVWSHEFPNGIPLGFIPNQPMDNKDLSGGMKVEL